MRTKLDQTVGHTSHGSPYNEEGCSFLILKELRPLHHSLQKERAPLGRMWAEIPVLPQGSSDSKPPVQGKCNSFNLSPWLIPTLRRWQHQAGPSSLKTSSLSHQLKLRTALGRAAAVLAQPWQCRGWAPTAAPWTKGWHIQFSLLLKRLGSKQANVRLNIFNIYNE